MTKTPLNPGDFSEEEQRFARRLWAARKLAGLTHAALSAETDIAKNYISYIENLKANPSLLTCARLARGVGRDLGDLMTARRIEDLDSYDGWKPS
jgi:transcriptional regulator with XRE-family HTH domain